MHLFHKWQRWRVFVATHFRDEHPATFQSRTCEVCGKTQSEILFVGEEKIPPMLEVSKPTPGLLQSIIHGESK